MNRAPRRHAIARAPTQMRTALANFSDSEGSDFESSSQSSDFDDSDGSSSEDDKKVRRPKAAASSKKKDKKQTTKKTKKKHDSSSSDDSSDSSSDDEAPPTKRKIVRVARSTPKPKPKPAVHASSSSAPTAPAAAAAAAPAPRAVVQAPKQSYSSAMDIDNGDDDDDDDDFTAHAGVFSWSSGDGKDTTVFKFHEMSRVQLVGLLERRAPASAKLANHKKQSHQRLVWAAHKLIPAKSISEDEWDQMIDGDMEDELPPATMGYTPAKLPAKAPVRVAAPAPAPAQAKSPLKASVAAAISDPFLAQKQRRLQDTTAWTPGHHVSVVVSWSTETSLAIQAVEISARVVSWKPDGVSPLLVEYPDTDIRALRLSRIMLPARTLKFACSLLNHHQPTLFFDGSSTEDSRLQHEYDQAVAGSQFAAAAAVSYPSAPTVQRYRVRENPDASGLPRIYNDAHSSSDALLL